MYYIYLAHTGHNIVNTRINQSALLTKFVVSLHLYAASTAQDLLDRQRLVPPVDVLDRVLSTTTLMFLAHTCNNIVDTLINQSALLTKFLVPLLSCRHCI